MALGSKVGVPKICATTVSIEQANVTLSRLNNTNARLPAINKIFFRLFIYNKLIIRQRAVSKNPAKSTTKQEKNNTANDSKKIPAPGRVNLVICVCPRIDEMVSEKP